MTARGSLERRREWLKVLPEVIRTLNNETIRMIRIKPSEAIKAKSVIQKPSLPIKKPPAEIDPVFANVRYLFQPGELEDGNCCATDPIWSIEVYKIKDIIPQKDQPAIYYLENGPKTWVFSGKINGYST